MRVTGTAQREAWLARAFPPVEQVRPDLWSVPVPIPGSPLRYTLTYVVAGGSDLIVVDPGWDDAGSWQALERGLGAVGAGPADVTGVVVTRRLRAVWTPGHTPGHLCLYEEAGDLLLTGDHVLPRITPNVGLQRADAEPPLAAYLESLRRVAGFAGAEALPAHEYRFHGLADRVAALLAHHDRRCEEVVAILERLGPATIWQVTQELSWARGWAAVTGMMRRAALGEAAAHLRHLAGLGRITETAGEVPAYAAPGR